MDGVLAINELNDLTKRLGTQIKKSGEYGRDLAKATQEYNVAIAQTIAKLRADGQPATLVEKLAKGEVASIQFKRDVAEIMYNTSREEIMATKLKIRVLDAQIAREWGQNV